VEAVAKARPRRAQDRPARGTAATARPKRRGTATSSPWSAAASAPPPVPRRPGPNW